MKIKLLFLAVFLICIFTKSSYANDFVVRDIENDQFSSAIKINGVMLYENPFAGTFRSWFIRSWIDKKTKVITHQLYIEIKYIGKSRFYMYSTDNTAVELETTNIDSKVGSCFGGCSITEVVGIDLPDEKIKNIEDYPIKLTAKSGDSLILTIEKEQLSAQIQAIKIEMDKLNKH